MKKLRDEHAVLVRNAKVKEIKAQGVVAETKEGEQLVEADTVIVATMAPLQELADAKKRIFTIGDAIVPRRGASAIFDGYKLGMRL